MRGGITVTGTDTGCGKTYFTWLFVRALRKAGVNAVGWKPYCCGERGDAYSLFEASDQVLSLEEVNPVWYRTPIAPFPAGELEGKGASTAEVVKMGQDLLARFEVVVCEGVGGWEVPLEAEENFSDFALDLGWPVLTVVGNRLGALNHSILTVDAIQAKGCDVRALVLNQVLEEQDVASVTNRGVLEQRFGKKLLGEVMFGEDELSEALFEELKAIC